ncbi:pheromone A receptor-domain-containing protein [Suillus fuscotomentosus]|uniref:Pheromone A receptor-domain-containing protein n=1 Tax=Suillus fuscotomentosus TaxID=1912939 RepID=A0AAD4EA78_9AGAM|nr:pheromone A receptor-domain-containing protein [Suillus fuscotomentosus]KAG1901218.1 pheromone A receptor-domain-containing protein [Suillus fuscotomentosus]
MFVQLPATAFICATLVLVPIPWHWRAGNISTIAISLWLFVGNIIYGINSIIWGNTVQNIAPVWCDITTKLEVGSTVALPAAMFSLCMHLERVAAIRDLSLTHSKKRCRQIVESALCFGVPLIYMALQYIVQGHRFDIVEGFGCRPTIYVSIASIFLIWVPPLVFSLGAGIFAATAFSHFWKRRALFSKHLKNTGSALTPSRYFRLMSMAIVEMFFGLLVTILNMWWTMRPGLRPWISWENVHSDWLEVAYFPLAIIPPSELAWTFALWFTIPIASVFFFLFFAFGRDAVKEYGATFRWIRRHVLRVQDRPSPGLYPLITVARPCNMPQSSNIDLCNKKKGTPTGIPYSTSPCHIDLARGTGLLKSDCAPALPYTSPPASSYFKYQEQYSRGSDRDGRPSGMDAV